MFLNFLRILINQLDLYNIIATRIEDFNFTGKLYILFY